MKFIQKIKLCCLLFSGFSFIFSSHRRDNRTQAFHVSEYPQAQATVVSSLDLNRPEFKQYFKIEDVLSGGVISPDATTKERVSKANEIMDAVIGDSEEAEEDASFFSNHFSCCCTDSSACCYDPSTQQKTGVNYLKAAHTAASSKKIELENRLSVPENHINFEG